MSKNFVITIARGFGSGGKEIGTAVSKLYGINCYEHGILTLAAQMSGLDRSQFAAVDEKIYRPNIIETIKDSIAPAPTKEQLFDYQAQIIRGLASSESCVIVGKCADYILRDFDKCTDKEVVLTLEPHLTVFDGLKNLSNMDDIKVQEAYETPEIAFDAAVAALREILERI